MTALLAVDLRHVFAGVPGPTCRFALRHAALDGFDDRGVQLGSALGQRLFGASERARYVFEGVGHVAECDTAEGVKQ